MGEWNEQGCQVRSLADRPCGGQAVDTSAQVSIATCDLSVVIRALYQRVTASTLSLVSCLINAVKISSCRGKSTRQLSQWTCSGHTRDRDTCRGAQPHAPVSLQAMRNVESFIL
jgi:hypothetical protein